MKKTLILYLTACLTVLSVFSQNTKFKGTMTVGDYTRKNVVIEVKEHGNKADGTIYRAKFARLMPIKVDADIKNLNRTVQADKIFLSGNNLIPYVKGQAKEKYMITGFNGVIHNGELSITTRFGEKKVTYKGKKIQ
ncbi:MAG: hypothetical protein IJ250_03690 [Bacteroidales bacterium]|nr:hypothetical protein [Bacteroidales bacterium]MBQ7984721.1 hypothetical protein [Bacteroidales bacterium]